MKFNPLLGKSLRPNEQRARNAVIMVYIVMAFEIICLLSSLLQFFLLRWIAAGESVSEQSILLNDTREMIVSWAYLGVYIASGVIFIMWFRRAYYNLHTKISYLNYDEGWAAGAWFVPFLNLVRPYQIMNELYIETKRLLAKKEVTHNPDILKTNYLGVWWGLWILNGILGGILSRMGLRADTVDELIVITVGYMITYLIGIPLALVTVKVIRDYSKSEPLLRQIKNEETQPGEKTEQPVKS